MCVTIDTMYVSQCIWMQVSFHCNLLYGSKCNSNSLKYFVLFFSLLCHVTCWCCWTSKWIVGLLEYFLTNRKYSSVEQTHGYTMHQLIHQINRFDNLILSSDISYSTDTPNIFTCLMLFSIHILRTLLPFTFIWY